MTVSVVISVTECAESHLEGKPPQVGAERHNILLANVYSIQDIISPAS